MNTVSQADSQSCKAWVISSNPINEGFYNFHGFVEIDKLVLGADNPTWTDPPMVMQVVSDIVTGSIAWRKHTDTKCQIDGAHATFLTKKGRVTTTSGTDGAITEESISTPIA